MGNSYCKKNYSRGEVNVVEITQTRLHKMKRNVAIASSCCLINKIGKKIVLYVIIRRGKMPGLCCEKTNISFLYMFVIKYS